MHIKCLRFTVNSIRLLLQWNFLTRVDVFVCVCVRLCLLYSFVDSPSFPCHTWLSSNKNDNRKKFSFLLTKEKNKIKWQSDSDFKRQPHSPLTTIIFCVYVRRVCHFLWQWTSKNDWKSLNKWRTKETCMLRVSYSIYAMISFYFTSIDLNSNLLSISLSFFSRFFLLQRIDLIFA